MAALDAGPPQADVTQSVQAELRRVGCLSAEADGNWNTSSQRSLTLFNRYAKTKLDTKLALDRRARHDQAEDGAGLPAGLRARLPGRRRALHEDHLRRGLVSQRR